MSYFEPRELFLEMEKVLKENKVSPPYYVHMSPFIWHGYWLFSQKSKLLRWIGRKLKNKYIYWLGFNVRWQKGIKEYYMEFKTKEL